MPSSEHSDAAKSKGGARGVKKRSTPVQAERRRAQNRISQQCLREKNLAYVRHLENVTQALQASKDSSNNDRYSMLLEVHLKVVDENRRLEEALFRLRKKLLSLSNSASSAAEDPIFDTLLGRENNKPQGSDDSLDPSFEFSPDSPLPLTVTGNQHSPPPVGQGATQGGQAYAGGLLDPEFNQCMQQAGGVTGLEDLLSGNNALTFENITSVQLIPVPRPALQSQDRLYVTCTTTFGQSLLNACKEWLKRCAPGESMQYPEPQERQIKDISRAATHILATRIGLESYIYGVNGALHIERLFGWRLGATNHKMIPKPFRPTPLQARRPQHLMGIDLFNWPEIRDQLVLEEPRLDIDSLMRDLTIHSVIEQPQHGVAVGVYDLFQNHILPRAKDASAVSEPLAEKSWLFDRSWVFYDVDVKSHRFRGLTSDPLLEAMVEELDRRVQTLRSGEAGADLGPDWPRGDKFQRNEIALFFGLDNMSTWKLGKEFAEKYPFLDCSSATSQFKTVPASSIFGRL